MKVNSVNNNYKMSFGSFKGEKKRKPVYKEYYELNDTQLAARSIGKAVKTVEKSGKMRLLKSLPIIATSVIATSLAISQPGKLSGKVKTGLGFLALASGIDLLTDKMISISENENLNTQSKRKKALKTLGVVALGIAGAFGLVKNNDKVGNFLKSESEKLASEINATRLAKFTDEKLTPFMKKHKVLEYALGFILPAATLFKTNSMENKLKNEINSDFQKNVILNFAKGKEIQRIAREHFNSIDVKEA